MKKVFPLRTKRPESLPRCVRTNGHFFFIFLIILLSNNRTTIGQSGQNCCQTLTIYHHPRKVKSLFWQDKARETNQTKKKHRYFSTTTITHQRPSKKRKHSRLGAKIVFIDCMCAMSQYLDIPSIGTVTSRLKASLHPLHPRPSPPSNPTPNCSSLSLAPCVALFGDGRVRLIETSTTEHHRE